MDTVELFGEKITLVRPMGRKGVMYMQKAIRVFRRLLVAIEPAQKKASVKGASEIVVTSEMLSLLGEYIDDAFLNEVLPGLYIYSEQRLSMKDALAKIDAWPITMTGMAEIFQAFMEAMSFWSKAEDEEAFDEALKKSKDVEVESEGDAEKASES